MRALENLTNKQIRALPLVWAVSHVYDHWPEIHFVYIDKTDPKCWWFYEPLWYNHTSNDFRQYSHWPSSTNPVVWFFEDKNAAINYFKKRCDLKIQHIRQYEADWIERLDKEFDHEKEIKL